MALRSVAIKQNIGAVRQSWQPKASKFQFPEEVLQTDATSKFLEEDALSLCSTNITSTTPTFESLPSVSHDAEPESDAKESEPVVEESSTNSNSKVDDYLLCCKDTADLTNKKSEHLQTAVDKIFAAGAASLLGLKFPAAIADPQLKGCPLIGCSYGFTSLYGYQVADVVGQSSKFLLNAAPDQQSNQEVVRRYQEFCLAAAEGKQYKAPSDEFTNWLTADRPSNELIAVQTSVSKSGKVFETMFLISIVELGDFDQEQSYIVVLQSELPGAENNSALLARHLVQLDKNMATVQKVLGQDFVVSGTMRRQDIGSSSDDDAEDGDDENDSDAVLCEG